MDTEIRQPNDKGGIVIAGILLIVGFGTLIIAFASASKFAGRIRPFIGIGLILAPIITAMLDFTVWAIAESRTHFSLVEY